MTLDQRSASIVQLAARFKQLTSEHIQTFLFNELSSKTPRDRALKRLVKERYLLRIERRTVGGSRGGSGQYVYALDRRGFYLYFDGRFDPMRNIDYHSLAIADCYVELLKLERAGQLVINGYSTEPDSWRMVGPYDLRPDFAVDVSVNGTRPPLLWFEVDMGTERQKQLRVKLEDYWLAYKHWKAEGNDPARFPRVVWVGIDQARVKELRWLLSEGSDEAQALFRVCTKDELVHNMLEYRM